MSLRLPRQTVRIRLTLLYGGVFVLAGAALVGITYGLFEHATEYTKPQLPQIPHAPTIQDVSHNPSLTLALSYLRQPQKPLKKGDPQLAQALPQLAHVQHQLAEEQQRLVLAIPKAGRGPARALVQALPLLAHDQHQLVQGQRQLAQAVNQLSQAVHQVARAGSAQAAQRAADSHQLLVDSAIALGIVAVLALLASWLVAGRMLRPIRTITRTARRISSTSLHERLALEGPQDELKELGDTLDELFGRLEAAFEAQRQFVANASHELRAPLTRQRALIQVALADPRVSFSSLRAAHERVLASEQHLEQLIDGLLTLTRGQAGVERREPLDLAELTSQAMLARSSQFARFELDARAALAPAPTAGDPRLIERLIANLIDNAIRHNVPGGHVALTTGTRPHHTFVSIENTGPAVPPDEVQRLFEPFQRLDGARTRHYGGYGLGLSIVHAIVNAHQAELSATARPEGGLTIEVAFQSVVTAAGWSAGRNNARRRGRSRLGTV